MRKIVAILLFVLIMFACSTNDNSNVNSITVPPINLTGVVVLSTQINLYWTDDLTEELGFKIERKTETGSYVIVGIVNSDTLTYSDTDLTPGTTYTYRVYSYSEIDNSPTYSNELSLTTTNTMILPILTTTETSEITTTTAVSGGTVLSDGASVVTAIGVVWSTSSNATIILSTKTINDIGVGTYSYTSSIIGLTANTTYYIRAYATNSFGTAYGNEYSFTTNSSTEVNIPGPNVTDIDGNVYQTVTNCNQTWTKTNLNTSHYRNGDGIPQVTDPIAWAKLTTGAWCYYNNDPANGATYGKLYNWYAVHDSRGLAPVGFHIPTDVEWTTLSTCLGGESVAGGKMKATTLWNNNIGGIYPPIATNSSGFSALPGGYRNSNGEYFYIKDYGYWWSSTEVNTEMAYDRYLIFYTNAVGREGINKSNGWSVRCLRD